MVDRKNAFIYISETNFSTGLYYSMLLQHRRYEVFLEQCVLITIRPKSAEESYMNLLSLSKFHQSPFPDNNFNWFNDIKIVWDYVTHVPRCMSGSLASCWSRWWGKRSMLPRRMHNSHFYASGKRPIECNHVSPCLGQHWWKITSNYTRCSDAADN